jgi:hypothetical protein
MDGPLRPFSWLRRSVSRRFRPFQAPSAVVVRLGGAWHRRQSPCGYRISIGTADAAASLIPFNLQLGCEVASTIGNITRLLSTSTTDKSGVVAKHDDRLPTRCSIITQGRPDESSKAPSSQPRPTPFVRPSSAHPSPSPSKSPRPARSMSRSTMTKPIPLSPAGATWRAR